MERGRESNPHGQLGQLEIVVIDAGLGFDPPTGCSLIRGVMLCASVCATAGRSQLSAAMRG
jgi:hypothetical protein